MARQTDRERVDELMEQVARACGEIGSLTAGDLSDDTSDVENYEFQIQTGLADAVVNAVFKMKHADIIHWFGYCLIASGHQVDDRLQVLLDSMDRELESRMDHVCPDCEAAEGEEDDD